MTSLVPKDRGDDRIRTIRSTSRLLNLPGSAVHTLLGLRTAALTLAEPLDYAARYMNGKLRFPPLSLRRYAGPLATLEASGGEFLAYLKLLCQATADSRILDIGCGFGLMALALEPYLNGSGGYVGLDINHRAIDWANRTISSRKRTFEFHHLDIRNGMYNPRGRLDADTVALPLPQQSFDIVLLKSVFTHLRPAEVRNYLQQTALLLDREGVGLATFFLLNDEQRARRATNTIDFAFGDDIWRYSAREMPEVAVAYEQQAIVDMIAEAGLRLTAINYGSWSGLANGLSYQDIVLFSRQP